MQVKIPKKIQKLRLEIFMCHLPFLRNHIFGPLSLNMLGSRGYIYVIQCFRESSPCNIALIRSHETARGDEKIRSTSCKSEKDGKWVTSNIISQSRQMLSKYRHLLTTHAIDRYTKESISGENKIGRGECVEDWTGKRKRDGAGSAVRVGSEKRRKQRRKRAEWRSVDEQVEERKVP